MDTNLRRQGKRLFVWLLVLAVVVVSVGVAFFGTPFHGTDASIAATQDQPGVTVSQEGGTYVIEPATGEPEAGLVFYPGARVHPDAYVAALAPLARDANVTVVVPKMPLNVALLGQGVASRYVDGGIDTWYVGGHSLGGVAACRYARANPDRVDGVVLYASYCDRDVSGTDLRALSVTGTADTVLDRDAYDANRGNLPADATARELSLNHSQFGSYRGQFGDEPSDIPYARAHEQLANVTVRWVRAGG